MKTLFIILISILGRSAYSQECSWSTIKNQQYTSSMTLGQVVQLRTQREISLKCLATSDFSKFIQFGVKIQYRTEVTDPLDQALFLQELKKQALDQTLNAFAKSSSLAARNFASAVQQKLATSGIGFSLSDSDNALEDRPAGYVRAQGHIIMNYDIMTRDDWLFLFIHEFSHFIDPTLTQAVGSAILFFQLHPNAAAQIIQWSRNITDYSQLTPEQQTITDQFLCLSLLRGWLAEITAWASTMEVYQDLRAQGLVQVPWADQMLRQKTAGQTWREFFSIYLRNRFQYPKDGIYSNPVLLARSDLLEKALLK